MTGKFETRVVPIGDIPLGGKHPVRIQSMTNTRTLDTQSTVSQCIKILEAGADYVRITAPGIQEAEHLAIIQKNLREKGFFQPLIADIHFNPAAAETAARIVSKVRINPGNYADPRNSGTKSYSQTEYKAELERIHTRLLPLIRICKEYGTAIRVGTNHGSLNERIVHRFGNTPEGMAESAMEFVRIFHSEGLHSLVLSMKASNTAIMIHSTRQLVEKMIREGMNYPIHLGVTEAGNGEDGRIRSAIGIGTLLQEGIGNTVRVSLTEEPEAEVPVARKIIQYCQNPSPLPTFPEMPYPDPSDLEEKSFFRTGNSKSGSQREKFRTFSESSSPREETPETLWVFPGKEPLLSKAWDALFKKYQEQEFRNPVILRIPCKIDHPEDFMIQAACSLGPSLTDHKVGGLWLDTGEYPSSEDLVRSVALNILQACRLRMSKTEFISCPSCGRTLYDIQKTVSEIKKRTGHLPRLKIAIMGCIVNGPGEMADADYGYVGAAPGKVSLYKGKNIVQKNIPEKEAVDALIELIRNSGDWKES